MALYDGFDGDGLDPRRWARLATPLAGGGEHVHFDPSATVTVADGTLEVDVRRFRLAHDGAATLDNPKVFYRSRQAFELPSPGRVRFAVEMAADNHGGNPDDPRDGVVGFNVVDFRSGRVFDWVASERRVWALHEQVAVAGVDPDTGFMHLVESPLAGVETSPGQLHDFAITLERDRGRARWYVDDTLCYEVEGPGRIPEKVRLGLGIFTIHPQRDGRSTSLRGQGMRARWRNVRYWSPADA